MTIWMDLTNSLVTWNGGVVGIIRAELEIAKNLHDIDPNIKFSVCTGTGFKEVKDYELQWLWNTDSVGDAYIKHFNRYKYLKKDNGTLLRSEYPGLDNAYRFSNSRLIRLKEGIKLTIQALPNPINKILFYPAKFTYKCLKKAKYLNNILKNKRKNSKLFEHPYAQDDIIFSCGWINSGKEECFSKILETENINIVYLIYDIIIAKGEFKHFYRWDYESFNRYLYWISCNCKKVIYGGNTAKLDAENYFKNNNWNIPSGDFVKFGSDVYYSDCNNKDIDVLKKYGITEDFIITVGSIEPRKNFKTLYRAYCLLIEKYDYTKIPTLVIIGKNVSENDLVDKIVNTPLVNKKIIIVQPTDSELDILYKKCKFVLLPSLYEGWSLTLPEGLNYGKLCICSDVAPLREIAEGIAIFIPPLDADSWASKIMYFYNNKEEIKKYEDIVKKQWISNSWFDTAKKIYRIISNLNTNNSKNSFFTLYYDLTLLYYSSFSNASVSGILRTQLILLRYLNSIYSNIKYFALTPNGYISYTKNDLFYLLNNESIDTSFKKNKELIINKNISNKENMTIVNYNSLKNKFLMPFWLLCSVFPTKIQKSIVKYVREKNNNENYKFDYSLPFSTDDIVFTVGTGYDINSYKQLMEKHEKIKFLFIQLVYDYTPLIVPQTHRESTINNYILFLKYTNLISDVIFYGGKTAMRDGIYYQKSNAQIVKPSHVVKFGSNIIGKSSNSKDVISVLDKYNLKSDFILTVGSIEARKNHEILYDAYLYLIEQEVENIPKLVICGYPGWKTGDFVSRMMNDERTQEYIIIKSFSDLELDILYRNCLFTVLPSLYEGWSLTLPESLNYGKFCIASAVDPLIEIGKDFIDYVNPYDVKAWASKIMYYYNNREKLLDKEKRIHDEWHTITWNECAENVVAALKKLAMQGANSFKEGDEFLNE